MELSIPAKFSKGDVDFRLTQMIKETFFCFCFWNREERLLETAAFPIRIKSVTGRVEIRDPTEGDWPPPCSHSTYRLIAFCEFLCLSVS